VDMYFTGDGPLTELTNELAIQRLANSSFSVLSAALLQISKQPEIGEVVPSVGGLFRSRAQR
jgi:hypothetical protein